MLDVDALLPDVDWGAMETCRGVGADVPRLLRDSVHPIESDQRRDARDQLMGALCYQGSIFEPTLHAAPVFLAALHASDEEIRLWGLDWMSVLANAYTMTEGQGTLSWVAADHPERPAIEAQFEREKSWVAGIQRTVWQGVVRLLELVREGEQERWRVDAPRVLLEIMRNARPHAPAQNLWKEPPRPSVKCWSCDSQRIRMTRRALAMLAHWPG